MTNCQICGRASSTGAKLCADCRSARQRAFAATVTQPLLAGAGGRSGARFLRPSRSVAATARRAAERSLYAKPPAAAPAAAQPGRLDLRWLLAALVGLLLLAAFGASLLQKTPQAETTVIAPQPAPVGTPRAASAQVAMPPGPPPRLVVEAQRPNVGAIPIAEATPAQPVKGDTARRAASKPRSVAVEAVPPPEEPAPAPVVIALPRAPVAEVREVPKPDPLQVMNDNLARCAAGGLFDRIVCDQRVRLEYCEGRWGQVPQCPSGVPMDRGQ